MSTVKPNPQMAKLDARGIEYRREILRILEKSQRGHIGSAFSIMEVVRVLYDSVLRFDPKRPQWQDRDRFILSKGHGCLAVYLLLAEKGYFPRDELFKFCQFEAMLGGHPEYGKIPGIEASTGSLGHGLSIGVGTALVGRMDHRDFRTLVLVGDGECNEGSVWEAALSAGKHKLSSLSLLIDYNKFQSFGSTYEIQDLEPLADKWRSFNFAVREVDGHDVPAVEKALAALPYDSAKPSALICHTVKGKGIPSAENNPSWHHKTKMKEGELESLLAELEANA
ncbi:MAG TPA: transketolase [Kiritimatiellia bacterium]|jgi:transketolase